MTPTLIAYLVAAVSAGLLLFVLLRLRIRGMLARRRARLRGMRAARGEREAEFLLRECGYRVESRQEPVCWTIECGEMALDIELRADLVVTRDGCRYVAEVKTGSFAPSLYHAATRRQLLEYFVAYAADGVLLIDVESWRIHEVRFFVEDRLPGGLRRVATAPIDP